MMTKQDIESLAREIMEYLVSKKLDEDLYIYYNNKRMHNQQNYDSNHNLVGVELVIEDDICPFEYFKYANHKHILSMSFEGNFYSSINHTGYGIDGFSKILDRYGLYYELGEAWNLSVYPIRDEMYDEIEYTDYSDLIKPDRNYICSPERQKIPKPIVDIMIEWYELSTKTGDLGGCVIGAGFEFTYEGTEYFMSAQSKWQGSLSWEPHVPHIKERLEKIGATEIHYRYGVLD